MITNNNTKNKITKIRVVVRKRPANHREFAQNDIDIITTEGKNTIIVKELKNKVDLTKYIEEHNATFHSIVAMPCQIKPNRDKYC